VSHLCELAVESLPVSTSATAASDRDARLLVGQTHSGVVSTLATAARDRDTCRRQPEPASSRFNPRDRSQRSRHLDARGHRSSFQPTQSQLAIATFAQLCGTAACRGVSTRATANSDHDSTGSGTRRAITVPFQPARPRTAIVTPHHNIAQRRTLSCDRGWRSRRLPRGSASGLAA